MDEVEPLIDYPWSDFLRDFGKVLSLGSISPDILAKALPYENPDEAYNRGLVVARVWDYFVHNRDKLIAQKTISAVQPEGIRIPNHVLQTLHYFLVRQPPQNWDMIPPPEYFVLGNN